MPFIGGRYYANPIAGKAVEAAREAEAALLALKRAKGRDASALESDSNSGEMGTWDAGDKSSDESADSELKSPIHRVEIEAAELVPSHSGRAQRGFVARVHREAIPGAPGKDSWHAPAAGQVPSRGYAPNAETHVFAGHGDLLDFLKSELQGPGKP